MLCALLSVWVLPGVKTCWLLVGHLVRNGPCWLHGAFLDPADGVAAVPPLFHQLGFASLLLF